MNLPACPRNANHLLIECTNNNYNETQNNQSVGDIFYMSKHSTLFARTQLIWIIGKQANLSHTQHNQYSSPENNAIHHKSQYTLWYPQFGEAFRRHTHTLAVLLTSALTFRFSIREFLVANREIQISRRTVSDKVRDRSSHSIELNAVWWPI